MLEMNDVFPLLFQNDLSNRPMSKVRSQFEKIIYLQSMKEILHRENKIRK